MRKTLNERKKHFELFYYLYLSYFEIRNAFHKLTLLLSFFSLFLLCYLPLILQLVGLECGPNITSVASKDLMIVRTEKIDFCLKKLLSNEL